MTVSAAARGNREAARQIGEQPARAGIGEQSWKSMEKHRADQRPHPADCGPAFACDQERLLSSRQLVAGVRLGKRRREGADAGGQFFVQEVPIQESFK